MTILIAEDEVMMSKTIEFRLKKDGHCVLSAKDGKEAIAMLDLYSPDMVITDIMMPYASGLEVVAAVRLKKGGNIPIVVLSAMGQENTVLEAFDLGADDYVTKPFSPNELSMRVKRILFKLTPTGQA